MPYYDQNGQPVLYDPAGYGGSDASADTQSVFGNYPTLGAAIDRRKGVLGPALKSGAYDLAGMLGAGVGAVGGALGADSVRDWGIGVSDAMGQRSQAAGRPDLEVMPWSNDWGKDGQTTGDIGSFLAYQAAKQIPQVGAMLAGGGVVGAGMRAAGIVAPGAELAATLPEWMGGGALKAGMSEVEQNAARAAGKDLAERYAGTTVAGMPQAAGSMYQQEVERAQNAGEAPSQGAAMAALGLSPVYSALDAAAPSETVGMLKRGLSGNLGRRLATAALSEGAQEMVQEAAQTGMEMGFRPDLSAADKAQNIIDAALVGGLVGGMFGSAGGIRRLKIEDPASMTTEDISQQVDNASLPQDRPLPASVDPSQTMTTKQVSDQFKTLQDAPPTPDLVNQLYTTLAANNGNMQGLSEAARRTARDLGIRQGKKTVSPEEAEQFLADRVNSLGEMEAMGTIEAAQQQQLDIARVNLPIIQEAVAFRKAQAERTAMEEKPAAVAADVEKTAADIEGAAAMTPPAPPVAEEIAPPPAPFNPMAAAENNAAVAAEEGAPPPVGGGSFQYLASLPKKALLDVQEQIDARGDQGLMFGDSLWVARTPEGYVYQDANGGVSDAHPTLQSAIMDMARANEEFSGQGAEAPPVSFDETPSAPTSPPLDLGAQLRAVNEVGINGAYPPTPRPVREVEEAPPMKGGQPLKQDIVREQKRNTQGVTQRANLSQPQIVTTPTEQTAPVALPTSAQATINRNRMTVGSGRSWSERFTFQNDQVNYEVKGQPTTIITKDNIDALPEHAREPMRAYFATPPKERGPVKEALQASYNNYISGLESGTAPITTTPTVSPPSKAEKPPAPPKAAKPPKAEKPAKAKTAPKTEGEATTIVKKALTKNKSDADLAKRLDAGEKISETERQQFEEDKSRKLFELQNLGEDLPPKVREELLKLNRTDFNERTMPVVVDIALGRMNNEDGTADKEAALERMIKAGETNEATLTQMGRIIDNYNKSVAAANTRGSEGKALEASRGVTALVQKVGGQEVYNRMVNLLSSDNAKSKGEVIQQVREMTDGKLILTPRQVQEFRDGLESKEEAKFVEKKPAPERARTRPVIHPLIDKIYVDAKQAREKAAYREAVARETVARLERNRAMHANEQISADERERLVKAADRVETLKQIHQKMKAKQAAATKEAAAKAEKAAPTPQVDLRYDAENNRIKLGEYTLEVPTKDAIAVIPPSGTKDAVNFYSDKRKGKMPLRQGDAFISDVGNFKNVPPLLHPYMEAYLKGEMSPQEIVDDLQRRLTPSVPVSDKVNQIDKTQGAVGEPLAPTRGVSVPVTHATTVKDLHKKLLGMSQNKMLRQLAPLINKIGNIPVYFANPADVRAAVNGDAYYDANYDHIVMSDANVSNDEFAQWFLHEGVHAALQKQLDTNPQVQKDLKEIMDKLQKQPGIDADDYAFRNPSEFLAEALSRPDLQAALEKMSMGSQETGWRYFVRKAMEWLGLKGQSTALDNVLRAADTLEAARDAAPDMRQYIEKALGKDIDSTLTDAENAADNQRLFAIAARASTAGTDTVLQRLTKQIDSNMEQLTGKGSGHRLFDFRKTELFWSSFGHILSKWGSIFGDINDAEKNPVAALGKHMTQRAALTARMARLFGVARDQLEAFTKKNPAVKTMLNELMAITTEFGINPEISWDANIKANKTLQKTMKDDAAGRGKQLQDLHAKAQQMYNTLNKTAHVGAGRSIYHVYRDLNNMLMHSYQAVQLYNLAKSDPYFKDSAPHNSGRPSLKNVTSDPVETFLKQTALHEDPALAADYWEKATISRVRDMRTYLAHVKLLQDGGTLAKKDANEFERSRDPMLEMLEALDKQLATMKEAPYFHLGRHGDFIVRFKMKPTAASEGKDKEVVDGKVIAEVSKRLAEIYPDVRISPESDRPFVMTRFQNKDERDRFHSAILQLQKEGLIVPGTVEATARNDMRDATGKAPAWLERYIESIQADPALDDAQKRNMVSIARITWLDQLADTAVARVLAQRQYIPGYYSDMLRNYAFRAEVGVNSLANLSIASKVTEAFTGMKEIHEGLARTDRKKADVAFQVFSELQKRDADRPATTGRDWIDEWRATNQAFFLGMSPAYTLVNMSQVGVMLLPELAKRHGFVRAAKAIAAVTPKAFKIIRETFAEGKRIGWSRAFDAIITGDVLKRSSLDPEMREFLTRMINSGNIDLGSPMRELGRASEGIENKKWDQVLRFASSMGYYSETFTRLIAAMSAHELELEKKTPPSKIDQYAGGVLNDAMLNYSNWYTARATGKTGVLGRFTPIPASFQQYNLQVMQKLYRELFDAFSAAQPGESEKQTADRRSAARKFLLGHATVLGVLAGSLGMPFATVALRAVDALRDELGGDDDEPHDTKTDYRNFLADVFGPDVAEVLARGLPRAFGFDISTRVGEQDMAPMSKFIADRRKMEDRVKDFVFRSAGSPVGMAAGIANGGYEFAQGNYMTGLQMMVPNSIKGVLKATDMATQGYHDAKGVPLPTQPTTRDIAVQAFGFNPADKAEETERNMAMTTRKTLMGSKASALRNELADAASSGQMDSELMQKAARFDQKNPMYAVLPTLGATIERRQKEAAIANRLDIPLGMNPADLNERDRLRFANTR